MVPMSLTQKRCPDCNAINFKPHTSYTVKYGETRQIHKCTECGAYFSDTKNTPLAGLRTPLSRIIPILDALNEGLGINAAQRVFKVSKNSIYRWLDRLADLKQTLLLYALCHQFLTQLIEGDELYTRVHHNKPPPQSAGWTLVLMERASRGVSPFHRLWWQCIPVPLSSKRGLGMKVAVFPCFRAVFFTMCLYKVS